MTKTLKRILGLTAVLLMLLPSFAACDTSEAETESKSGTASAAENETEEKLVDFDYASADLSKYITISSSDYLNNTVTLSTDYLVSDEAVDEYINDILFKSKTKTNGDEKVVDQPIRLGDTVFIYYTGYLGDKAFTGGSNASDEAPYGLSIGSGSFIPGFEEGLIGVIPNETSKDSPFDLHVTFPENYGSSDLAGKAVVFKVWIEYTIQFTIPSLSDEVVKNTLNFDGTASEYKDYVRKGLQSELTQSAKEEALSAVLSKLYEVTEVKEYPKQSVDFYYESYIDYFEYYMDYYSSFGYKFESFESFLVTMAGFGEDSWQEEITALSKDSVHNSLICYSIAKAENISVSEDEFDKRVEELVKENSTSGKQYTAEEIIEQYGRQQITENLLFQKVNEFLMDNCSIEYNDQ